MFLPFLGFAAIAHAAVTVYDIQGQVLGSPTLVNSLPTATSGPSAVGLQPPAPPVPPPSLAFNVQLFASAVDIPGGVSILHDGAFYGFSIEQSIVNTVVGRNSTFIQVPFLNLLAAIKSRAGRVRVRVGGNSQERATMVETNESGKMVVKLDIQGSTPALLYTPDMFYLMSNVSALVNAQWYLGIPFNDTSNPKLEIASYGQRILGSNLLGLQMGNEPDLFVRNQRRPVGYSPADYTSDYGTILQALKAAQIPVAGRLIGPSIASVVGTWTPEAIWATGFLAKYIDTLGAIGFEHYSGSNCQSNPLAAPGTVQGPQDVFASYLTHTAVQNIVSPYANSSLIARQSSKELLMMETNSASCGGFPGVSDSFGAALWALDYAFALASANFAAALFHTGGQNVYYNPFTPPLAKEARVKKWTIGAIFYPALIVAEAFGKTKTAQIADLGANLENPYTPGYIIYNGGRADKVALFNYITDPSGGHDYVATISIGGPSTGKAYTTPPLVKVKYLAASSVSEKYNITWSGQTYGGRHESDGRLKGNEVTVEIPCPDGVCHVKVPAPGFALVFLDSASEINVPATATFPTTVGRRTASPVDPAALETSNGHAGKDRGSTSPGSHRSQNGVRRVACVSLDVVVLVGLVGMGAMLML